MVLGRLLFALTALVLAALAGVLFAVVITANGTTWLHVIQIVLLAICCVWLAWGFNTAVTGILFGRTTRRERKGGGLPPASRHKTAILVPVYNEDAAAVMARVAAMIEGLRYIRRMDGFVFFVLSDSTKAECVADEKRTILKLAGELETGSILFYRNRVKNVNRKAGNIEDYVTNYGGAYEYMIALDADSLMRPETLVEMVARMDADPELALLQTQPLIIGRKTLFGRALQFSAALYSPVFSRGIAALQGREGPFWGHNTIIRTKAFADCCGMPKLSGKPPFGGLILSHDFVEAALLSRSGWKVRLDPDLEGSFEEAPANIIEYAKRDRRWCQGNLQHGRLLSAPNLKLWSKVSMISGIMAYAASPIWLLFLIASMLDPVLAPAPNYFPRRQPVPRLPDARDRQGAAAAARHLPAPAPAQDADRLPHGDVAPRLALRRRLGGAARGDLRTGPHQRARAHHDAVPVQGGRRDPDGARQRLAGDRARGRGPAALGGLRGELVDDDRGRRARHRRLRLFAAALPVGLPRSPFRSSSRPSSSR